MRSKLFRPVQDVTMKQPTAQKVQELHTCIKPSCACNVVVNVIGVNFMSVAYYRFKEKISRCITLVCMYVCQ